MKHVEWFFVHNRALCQLFCYILFTTTLPRMWGPLSPFTVVEMEA